MYTYNYRPRKIIFFGAVRHAGCAQGGAQSHVKIEVVATMSCDYATESLWRGLFKNAKILKIGPPWRPLVAKTLKKR